RSRFPRTSTPHYELFPGRATTSKGARGRRRRLQQRRECLAFRSLARPQHDRLWNRTIVLGEANLWGVKGAELTSSEPKSAIATARNLELFPIDLKAASFAEAQTTAHPNARTHAASNDSWHAHGGRWASKERDRQTRSVVQVADEAEPPALAYKVHDQPSGVLTFRTAAPPTEQPSGIESSSSLAQIEVNVGVFDGAIDCGRIIAGDRERPDRQLPIARVQGYADCRTKFVPI